MTSAPCVGDDGKRHADGYTAGMGTFNAYLLAVLLPSLRSTWHGTANRSAR